MKSLFCSRRENRASHIELDEVCHDRLIPSSADFVPRDVFYPMRSLGVSINLLAFYHKCCNVIGYTTHYLFREI